MYLLEALRGDVYARDGEKLAQVKGSGRRADDRGGRFSPQ
jgi:hypothetical protein